jgi:type I restriction enzyme S subunit
VTWPALRLKHVADINLRTLSEDEPEDLEFRYVDIATVGRGRLVSEPERMRFADAPSRARRVVRPGDTIISTVRTYLRAVWPVSDPTDDLVVSTGFAVLSPRPALDPRFLAWWAQSDAFIEEIVARSIGVSYPAIRADEVGDIRIALPESAEQREIADFLEVETARIDALIEKKRRMTGVLVNREAAVMDRWAKGCFARFGAMALRRRITAIEQGWSPQCQNVAAEPEEWGVLRTSAVTSGSFQPSENKLLPDDIEPDLRWVVRDGDLLMTRGSGSLALVGQAVVARVDSRHLMISDLIYRIRLREQHPDFVAAVLRSPQLRSLIEACVRSDAGLTLKLRVDDIKGLPIPAASVSEQVRSCKDLDDMLRPLSQARQAIERQIGFLHEHRQALITSAVTGQLDVAKAAA